MRQFWALPALLRLAIASQHAFNVFDDLQAHPQYKVIFTDDAVSEENAASILSAHRSSSSSIGIPSAEVPSLYHAADQQPLNSESSKDNTTIAGFEAMVLEGKNYLCSIPYVPPEEDTAPPSNKTAEEEAKDLVRATERGWQLLKGMEGQCIYFISGWWSYSFCFNEGVKQFHQLSPPRGMPHYPPLEDTSVGSYILGRFDGAVSKSERKGRGRDDDNEDDRQKSNVGSASGDNYDLATPKLRTKGDARYLVQTLAGGTICDLTGKGRKVEVQFHCDPASSDHISLIKETLTCQYLMIISTPRLCTDVAFMPPQEKAPHPINCTPIMAADAIPAYLAAKQESKEFDAEIKMFIDKVVQNMGQGAQKIDLEPEELELAGQSVRKVVGGIEIGAHAVVPKGTTIEGSAVVGGGKETFIATIARSDGFIMSDKELAKLKMKDQSQVKGLKRDIEKVAQGKRWDLNVVDTAGGRELRAIIHTEDSDKEDNKENGVKKDKARKAEEKGENAEEIEESVEYEDVEAEEEDGEEGSEETYRDEL